MKKFRWWMSPVVAALLLLTLVACSQQDLFVLSRQGVDHVLPYRDEIYFSLDYIHSVQKKPIRENFLARAGDEEIIFVSLEFAGFGAGMPGGIEGELSRTERGYILDVDDVSLPVYKFLVSSAEDKKITIAEEEIELENIMDQGGKLSIENRRHSLIEYILKLWSGAYRRLEIAAEND